MEDASLKHGELAFWRYLICNKSKTFGKSHSYFIYCENKFTDTYNKL